MAEAVAKADSAERDRPAEDANENEEETSLNEEAIESLIGTARAYTRCQIYFIEPLWFCRRSIERKRSRRHTSSSECV